MRWRISLAPPLARHGITRDLDALDDPRRRLVGTAPPAARVGRALQSLQEVIEDLRHALGPTRQRAAQTTLST